MMAVILILFLVAVPSVSAAECAWLLWEELSTLSQRGESPKEWSIVGAGPHARLCDNAAGRAALDRARRWRESAANTVKVDGNIVTVTSANTVSSYRYLCLPDTIDPRPPKAAQR